MIGSLVQRRRPFALLHASGMRIGELRQAVFLETAATMVITSALGVALGLIFAYAAARQGGVAFRWPGLDVFALVGSGVLATLIFSTFALPLVKAATKHDAIRYE
jgi:ABC-type antimicrobial peptide transport system permease subunit